MADRFPEISTNFSHTSHNIPKDKKPEEKRNLSETINYIENMHYIV